jgi:hypothetical protein
MKSRTRERAIRVLMSSLLRSNLTMGEMREISEALISGDSLAREVGLLLANIAEGVEETPYLSRSKRSPDDRQSIQDLISEAVAIVRKRRLSKKDVLSLIGAVDPKAKTNLQKRGGTISDMLNEFFRRAPQYTLLQFLELLRGPNPSDAYLRGILKGR